MKTNKQLSLLLRSFDDELSDQEQKLLNVLLESSDEARSDFQELTTLRHAVSAYPKAHFTEGFTDRVVSFATESSSGATYQTARVYFLSGKMLRVAAMILLLVGISTLVWLQPKNYTAPLGQQVSRMLPDGSTVLLSGGASLRYKPFWGREERKVQLTGEAFFDVSKGSKTFVVETFNSEVRVLGTRFNVRAWPDQKASYTSVILEEGRVEVSDFKNPGNKHILLSSESIIVTADTTFPKKSLTLPIETKLAWRTGGLNFENELLVDVVSELSRRYNLRLSLTANLGYQRITYFQPNQSSIDSVLTDISQPHALAYRKTANGYELFAP